MDISQFLRRAASLWPEREAVVDGVDRFTYSDLFQRSNNLGCALISRGIKRGDVVSMVAPNCHEFLEAYLACAMTGIILNPINFRLSSREVAAIILDAGSRTVIVHSDFFKLVNEALAEAAVGLHASVPATLPNEQSVNEPDVLDALTQVVAFRVGEKTAIPAHWLDYESELEGASKATLEDITGTSSATANLYYTSGTTGTPKGVMLTNENISCHALCVIAELQLSDSDRWLHAAPMFHLADAWATFAITAVGGKHVILPYFNASEALSLIEREKITLSNLIPTMLNAMINDSGLHEFSYSSLRMILSGGAPISPDTVRRIVEAFACEYVQTYGMTETSPYLTLSLPKEHLKSLPPEQLMQLRSRTGRSFMGVQLKVVREDGSDVNSDDKEVGEIIARGPIVTPGYWNKPQETREAIRHGWLYTGDLAVIDHEGYLNIVDRKKDMIITGGENVYSTEVEYVLYEHSSILECAVFGLPDPTWGESVTAAVVLKNGHAVSADELIAFVKERIAHYKAPRRVDFLSALPKTGSGKIQKKSLRDEKAAALSHGF